MDFPPTRAHPDSFLLEPSDDTDVGNYCVLVHQEEALPLYMSKVPVSHPPHFLVG